MITNFKIYEKNTYYGKTVIDAAINSDQILLNKLIKQGANLDIMSNYNQLYQTSQPQTALMILASYEHFMRRNDKEKIHNRMAKKLIESGANINIKGYNNFTALMYASLYNNYHIREMLIKSGANWNVYNNQGNSFLEFLIPIRTTKNNQKEKVIAKYPDKYKEYLRQKELDDVSNKYNL